MKKKEDYFKPKKGLRQGDLISSYLCVLCIDKLSHMIIEKNDNGRWKSMKSSKIGLFISHILFSHDLLLFGRAMEGHMNYIMEVLERICFILV